MASTQEVASPPLVKQGFHKGMNPNSLAQLEKGKWKPGQSGNPAGSPRGPRLKHLLNAKLEEICPKFEDKRTWAEAIVIATLELALAGNSTALRELWDRLEGRVPLPLQHSGPNGGPMEIDVANAQEKLIEHMRKIERVKQRQKQRAGHAPPQGKR